VKSKAGRAEVLVELSDRMMRGHVSLPNGLGLYYPDEDGETKLTGVAPNELTSLEDRDKFAGTPWHKSVPVSIEAG
jgi:anaerobic selenocysteine-containing dehydrogenase